MTSNIVIIGVSTGGPVALRKLFGALPPLDAAFITILHITPGMDYRIVQGLESVATMPVQLATDGEYIRQGNIYLAPGGFHLSLEGNSKIVLTEGARVNFVQPSADIAMMSLLRPIKNVKIIGVILTGMGRDGVAGIQYVKSIGGITFAQDKESSAIYGMPKAAAETGVIDYEGSPQEIARKLKGILNELPED